MDKSIFGILLCGWILTIGAVGTTNALIKEQNNYLQQLTEQTNDPN